MKQSIMKSVCSVGAVILLGEGCQENFGIRIKRTKEKYPIYMAYKKDSENTGYWAAAWKSAGNGGTDREDSEWSYYSNESNGRSAMKICKEVAEKPWLISCDSLAWTWFGPAGTRKYRYVGHITATKISQTNKPATLRRQLQGIFPSGFNVKDDSDDAAKKRWDDRPKS